MVLHWQEAVAIRDDGYLIWQRNLMRTFIAVFYFICREPGNRLTVLPSVFCLRLSYRHASCWAALWLALASFALLTTTWQINLKFEPRTASASLFFFPQRKKRTIRYRTYKRTIESVASHGFCFQTRIVRLSTYIFYYFFLNYLCWAWTRVWTPTRI